MSDALWGTLAVTGIAVAFVHAALPTHWLPFVLAGRGQGWSHAKTMTVTAVAGGGHVLFTILLGVVVAWLGITVDAWTGSIFPWIASGVLILFGLHYWFRSGHDHAHHEHAHAHGHAGRVHAHHHAPAQSPPARQAGARRSDFAVVLALVIALTVSPCEGFLPVFVAGVRYGWFGFAVLCLILAVATLTGMLLVTGLTLRGLQHLKLEALARHEGRILGGILIALGIAVVVLET